MSGGHLDIFDVAFNKKLSKTAFLTWYVPPRDNIQLLLHVKHALLFWMEIKDYFKGNFYLLEFFGGWECLSDPNGCTQIWQSDIQGMGNMFIPPNVIWEH